MKNDIITLKPPLGWALTTVSALLEAMDSKNSVPGSEKKNKIPAGLIEWRDQVWKLERIK